MWVCNYKKMCFFLSQVLVVMLHPVNRLFTLCSTSMATLLLSYRSSQDKPVSLYTDILVTDQSLVAETTSAYGTTPRATGSPTPIVATLTPSPQGILHLVGPVHFMQEATRSLPLTLKYSTRQQLKLNKQNTVNSGYLIYLISLSIIQ